MKLQLIPAILLLLALTTSAQVASHCCRRHRIASGEDDVAAGTGKTVARVNGAGLTDRDLVREMFAIFPYAKQHNGFPEKLEPQIRKGALDMIIFEELVYQEAKRRNMTIPAERLTREEREFRKQFPSPKVYQVSEGGTERFAPGAAGKNSPLAVDRGALECGGLRQVQGERGGGESHLRQESEEIARRRSFTSRRFQSCRQPMAEAISPRKRAAAPKTQPSRPRRRRITKGLDCWRRRFPMTTTASTWVTTSQAGATSFRQRL